MKTITVLLFITSIRPSKLPDGPEIMKLDAVTVAGSIGSETTILTTLCEGTSVALLAGEMLRIAGGISSAVTNEPSTCAGRFLPTKSFMPVDTIRLYLVWPLSPPVGAKITAVSLSAMLRLPDTAPLLS